MESGDARWRRGLREASVVPPPAKSVTEQVQGVPADKVAASEKAFMENSPKLRSVLRWGSLSFLLLCVFLASLTKASSYLAYTTWGVDFFSSERLVLIEEDEPLVLELPVEVGEPLPAEGCRVAELLLLEDELEGELPALELPADVMGLALFVEDVAEEAGIR